jgi:tRNA-splicing endonuclease subunit Sen54
MRCEPLAQHLGTVISNMVWIVITHDGYLFSKSLSYGIWYPRLARVHVTVARGIHFSTMGHSAPRPAPTEKQPNLVLKRLELLPEEAIYLVERGTLFCWKENPHLADRPEDLRDVEGSPMSVQQAYAEMIGKEDLTLEKYQVCV